ncbi:DUF2459 domain-containing protein [Erythrobacteraceae bacterium CFH 75059]|uniref:DUF2459 domain-containing protein n=1 Tax=Qipengyuania thermophila TaxID=2509361 RepID=UPI001020BCC9|nr:DUF2459 domain-containing protein [Qipengyuania thermophila]TCD05354.1 DUF2459 domain-containing protein [Erythrobacteraceae bacterium CFH 75059]
MAGTHAILTRRGVWRAVTRAAAALVLVAAAYFLAAWAGSSLPRNRDWVEPDAGVDLLVGTNGLHTVVIMPIAAEGVDWRAVFPSTARPTPAGNLPTHVAIDWGEREVLLTVPEWSDLRPGTALRILVAGGQPVIRINAYAHPQPDDDYRILRLRPAEYRALAASIMAQLPPLPAGETRPVLPGFDTRAVHHASLGRYTIFNTCNTWIGNRLADAGVRTGWWTPLAGGVMKWVPRAEPSVGVSPRSGRAVPTAPRR